LSQDELTQMLCATHQPLMSTECTFEQRYCNLPFSPMLLDTKPSVTMMIQFISQTADALCCRWTSCGHSEEFAKGQCFVSMFVV